MKATHLTPLDKAIIAYRENPTPENRERLDAASKAHVQAFFHRQTREFMVRTR